MIVMAMMAVVLVLVMFFGLHMAALLWLLTCAARLLIFLLQQSGSG
jgi:hypothetical protein